MGRRSSGCDARPQVSKEPSERGCELGLISLSERGCELRIQTKRKIGRLRSVGRLEPSMRIACAQRVCCFCSRLLCKSGLGSTSLRLSEGANSSASCALAPSDSSHYTSCAICKIKHCAAKDLLRVHLAGSPTVVPPPSAHRFHQQRFHRWPQLFVRSMAHYISQSGITSRTASTVSSTIAATVGGSG